ncbi:MAG: PTS sugar transporter subunit IIA [Tepidisphaeraceae bacterium]
MAGHIDTRRREKPDAGNTAAASDQIMVCLSSRGPSSARLLRFGSRLAGRLNRNWYAVYVQTPNEDPLRIDAGTQRLLADTLTLANQLGATVFTFKGMDVPETILRFAAEYRVGQIVIGRPQAPTWWGRLLGRRSVAERLIVMTRQATVIVVDAEADDSLTALPASDPSPVASFRPDPPPVAKPVSILSTLSPDRIVIYQDRPSRADVLRELVSRVAVDREQIDVDIALAKILEREAQGSTSLNQGVSLPHARLDTIHEPEAAIAILHGGFRGDAQGKTTRVVFLLLTPSARAAVHLQAIALVSRLLQRHDVQRTLTASDDPAEIVSVLQG